ncbi:hypothetical protein D3C72_1278790 [compost metagenome]
MRAGESSTANDLAVNRAVGIGLVATVAGAVVVAGALDGATLAGAAEGATLCCVGGWEGAGIRVGLGRGAGEALLA